LESESPSFLSPQIGVIIFQLSEITEPPADVENCFVRICNTYDDLIGFLSPGALGMVPPPRFCAEAVAYRNHLSLAGVIIADMISSHKPTALCGPVPSTQRSKRPGHIVWAELETRAYIFGAVRNEPDAFTDSFLNELEARPDLFHYVTHSDSDPIGKIDVSGGSSDGRATGKSRGIDVQCRALPCMSS